MNIQRPEIKFNINTANNYILKLAFKNCIFKICQIVAQSQKSTMARTNPSVRITWSIQKYKKGGKETGRCKKADILLKEVSERSISQWK